MTNVRKMALVDPILLETLRNPTQPPVDTTLRDLDADMTNILDRTDIEVSDKVRLCNQALLRYNGMTKTRANKPTRYAVLREEKVVNEEDADEENDSAGEIVATMPKSLHMKVRVLTARLKNMVDGNDIGELPHEGVAIPGSNVTDLVHDLVRRRNTFDPIGWRQLASQLCSSNMPMELMANVARLEIVECGVHDRLDIYPYFIFYFPWAWQAPSTRQKGPTAFVFARLCLSYAKAANGRNHQWCSRQNSLRGGLLICKGK